MSEEAPTKERGPRFIGLVRERSNGNHGKKRLSYVTIPKEWGNSFPRGSQVIIELLLHPEGYQYNPRKKPELLEEPKQNEVKPQISLSIPQTIVKEEPKQVEEKLPADKGERILYLLNKYSKGGTV